MEKEIGGIGWVEVGTGDPETATRFYGELFGWSFRRSYGPVDYRELTPPGADGPSGGVFNHGGASPDYAVFFVKVADVPRTLEQAEALGGKTIVPPTEGGDGLVFAHLADPDGSHFAVYTLPAA
jgi:uncharacterized protein